MKRLRVDEMESAKIADLIELLSRGDIDKVGGGRVFECKTCTKKFPTFQALGGHRTGHKKPRLTTPGDGEDDAVMAKRPKVHGCPVCGMEFALGQALGGHMRRHRNVAGETLGADHRKVVYGDKEGICLDLKLSPPQEDDWGFLTLRLGY